MSAGKVLVTGATGYLGRHIVAEALRRGFQVVALCRNPDSLVAKKKLTEAQVLKGDITDTDSIVRAAKGCRLIIHAAGMVSRKPSDAIHLHRINVVGTETVLSAAHQVGAERVIHVSTSGTVAISKTANPIPNEQSPAPIKLINRWPYYRSKLYAERIALGYNRSQSELEVVVVSPSLLLGPGEAHEVATTDVASILRRKPLLCPSGGISFADVRDVAMTVLDTDTKGKAGNRYLLGACNWTMPRFVQVVAELGGTSAADMLQLPNNNFLQEVVYGGAKLIENTSFSQLIPDASALDMSRYFWYTDCRLAKTELNWNPRSGYETIQGTIDSICQFKLA